jgi:hypothetical protein
MENNIIIKRKVGRPKKIKDNKQNKDINKDDSKIPIKKEIKKIIVNFNDF